MPRRNRILSVAAILVLAAVVAVFVVGNPRSHRPSTHPRADTAAQMVTTMNPTSTQVTILTSRAVGGWRVLIARFVQHGTAQVGLIDFQLPNRGGYEAARPIGTPGAVTTLAMGDAVHHRMVYWLGVVINHPSVAFVQVTGPDMVARQAVQPGETALLFRVHSLAHWHLLVVSKTGTVLAR